MAAKPGVTGGGLSAGEKSRTAPSRRTSAYSPGNRKEIEAASQQPWTQWATADGDLTGHGSSAVVNKRRREGEHYRQLGLLSVGCPDATQVYVSASPLQRRGPILLHTRLKAIASESTQTRWLILVAHDSSITIVRPLTGFSWQSPGYSRNHQQ